MKRRAILFGEEPGVTSNIYFIQSGEFVKIGIAIDVETRMALFQIGNPIKLILIKAFVTERAYQEESDLHLIFDKYRVYGEWFRINSGDLKTVIDSETIDEILQSFCPARIPVVSG